MNAARLLEHFDRIADAPDAIPRLRRFILDLAVRGKLVEQDPNDEPAAELLKRISTITRSNCCWDDESDGNAPFSLPDGWEWSRLGLITTKTGSGSTPRGGQAVYKTDGVPFLRSQNVYNDGLRMDDVAFIDEDTHLRMKGTSVDPGDLLLNITGGSIGRCCRVPDSIIEANISQHVAIIRLALSGMRDFIHAVVLSPFFQYYVIVEQTGAGRGGLPKNRMDQIPVPIPPLAEQHRIVAKVDELMALCDELGAAQARRERRRDRLAAASLHRIGQPEEEGNGEAFRENVRFHLQHLPRLATRPEHIKALRQTILNLAVRGKLVPQDPNDEPAAELLKRTQAAKQQRRTAHVSSILSEDVCEDTPCALPKQWQWVRFGAVAEFINGDRGKNYPNKNEYVNEGVPWINTGHINPDGTLSKVEMNYISRHKFISLNSGKIQLGDLVYCLRGATIGKTAIVDPYTEGAIASSLMIIRLRPCCFNRYVYYYCISPIGRSETLKFDNGTAQPNLSANSVKQYFFPLPPLAEQHRIVAKVDELMALCDELETQLAAARTERARLLEALLGEALGAPMAQPPRQQPRPSAKPIAPPPAAPTSCPRPSPPTGVSHPMPDMRRGTSTARVTPTAPASAPPARDMPAKDVAARDTTGKNAAAAILAHMQPGQAYSRAQLCDALGLSTSQWNTAIRELKDAGRVVQTGEKRGAKYRIASKGNEQ